MKQYEERITRMVNFNQTIFFYNFFSLKVIAIGFYIEIT